MLVEASGDEFIFLTGKEKQLTRRMARLCVSISNQWFRQMANDSFSALKYFLELSVGTSLKTALIFSKSLSLALCYHIVSADWEMSFEIKFSQKHFIPN